MSREHKYDLISVPFALFWQISALFDGEEIQVKRTNEFSEHYDVNYADKYIRTGEGTFRGSCYPAAF